MKQEPWRILEKEIIEFFRSKGWRLTNWHGEMVIDIPDCGEISLTELAKHLADHVIVSGQIISVIS